MDINQEAGTAFSLTLPSGVGLSAQERIRGGERPELLDREIPEGENRLSELAPRPIAQSGRGEPPLFNMLFAEPFGKRAFEQAQREAAKPDEPPSGVTQRDVERLRLHLSLAASTAHEIRTSTGLTWIAWVGVPMAALAYSITRFSDKSGDWPTRTGLGTAIGLSAVGLGLGISFLAAPWGEEGLTESFAQQDFSTERARSREIPRYERELKRLAEGSQRVRRTTAWMLAISSVLTMSSGAFLIGQDAVQHETLRLQGPLNIVMGLGQIAFSVYLLSTSSRLMDNWIAYSRDPMVQQRNEE
jgi:hypothetical protein